MNKNIIIGSFMAVSLTAVLTGCDENAWNDEHLNGFEDAKDKPIEQVGTIDYTMTAADYKTLAGLSANKALAGDELKNALAAVGTNGCFSDQIPADKYAPALLASMYYSYDDGSSVRLTYKTSKGLPAELADAAAAQLYTVSEADYQDYVWESTDNFIEAFAPSKSVSRIMPNILKDEVDPAVNPYVVVSYNVASQEPVFGNVGGSDEPVWTESSVLGNVSLNDVVEIQGVVTGICAQGYMVSDKTGTILVYCGSSFDSSSMAIGNQVNISGTIGSYNKGLQVIANKAEVPFTAEVVGTQAVTYPTPVKVDGAALDAAITRTDNELAKYVELTGEMVVTERNINIKVAGAETAQGSVYQGTAAQKAACVNGATATVRGWFIAIAGGRYYNIVVTEINGVKVNSPRRAGHKAPAVQVPATTANALYHYDGSRWSVVSGYVVLTPDDYKAMGQNYSNISVADAHALLPIYLKQKFPYAMADAVENVMFLVYNSTSKTTDYHCEQYTFDGNAWTLNDGIVTETNQFVKVNGKWMFDPTVYITLPSGRGQTFSATYYQACVDWVYDNICVPLGDTSIKSGLFYVSSYGNNEYYSGTSAYQNNVDLRPDKAREQYAAGYEGKSNDEIVALMKQRFMNEVMPGALAKLHPDAKPMEGIDQIYAITFSVYTGETTTYVAKFKVTAPGKFEPVSCTWDD